MKNLITFIKTTVIGGLVVIIPLAIIVFVVGDTVGTLITATKPLTQDLPFGIFVNAMIAVLIVASVIIGTCFIAGFLLNTFFGKTVKNWLEKNMLERIPMYSTLRGLTRSLAGIDGTDYPVVEVNLYGSDSRVLGVLVDRLPDERHVVYIPSSPVVTVGQLHILPRTHIKETELSMVETIGCLSQMGLEAHKLYSKASM